MSLQLAAYDLTETESCFSYSVEDSDKYLTFKLVDKDMRCESFVPPPALYGTSGNGHLLWEDALLALLTAGLFEASREDELLQAP